MLSFPEFTKSLSQGDTPTASPLKRKSTAKQIVLQHKNGNLVCEELGKTRKSETIIIKTGIPACKNPTMIPLTKDQIDAVLKSLKVPIPLKGEKSSCEHSDDSTDLKSSNKRLAIDSDSESAPKKFKVEFPSPPSDDDGEQKILSEGSKTPKALHKTQEFSGNSDSEKCSNDIELAVPLSETEDTSESNTRLSSSMVGKVLKSSQSNVQRIAVQLPNQSPTILQFPVVSVGSPTETTRVTPSHVQILQGMPVSTTGRNGQPFNFMVPLTFSPPLTPDTSQSLFTFPSSTNQTTMVTQIQTSGATQMKKAITIPKFVTPTDRPVTTQFYRSTPGGLVPLSSSSILQISKETSSTVRKLDLPDISV